MLWSYGEVSSEYDSLKNISKNIIESHPFLAMAATDPFYFI
jgi:hypothetical protein